MHHQATCDCDQCLVAQMRSSDAHEQQHGWNAWHRRDAEILQDFIARRCQQFQCAEHSDDILQDTFIIGFRNVSDGRYQERSRPLAAYLHGIAKNLVSEAARLQKRVACDLEQMDISDYHQLSLDDQIFLEQVKALIHEAFAQQSRLSQQVIDGLYAKGKSSEELAQELHKTAVNIRAIARRSVIKSRDYLANQYKLHLSSRAIRVCLQLF